MIYFDFKVKSLKKPILNWYLYSQHLHVLGKMQVLHSWSTTKETKPWWMLKEYSVIVATSFYDKTRTILMQKDYFQNFTWFQYFVNKLCMIMCINIAP